MRVPQSRRNGRGTVSRVKAVTFAFPCASGIRSFPVLAQLVKSLFSSGQKLVGIRLMPDIPDQLILRQIQNRCSAMVSSITPRLDARCPRYPRFSRLKLTNLRCKNFQFLIGEFLDIIFFCIRSKIIQSTSAFYRSLLLPEDQISEQFRQIFVLNHKGIHPRNRLLG